MVLGGIGVPEDIPEVTWSMGIAPGAPVMVLGGVWEVVPRVGIEMLDVLEVLGVPELMELDELREELLTGLGSCLSTRCRALWADAEATASRAAARGYFITAEKKKKDRCGYKRKERGSL